MKRGYLQLSTQMIERLLHLRNGIAVIGADFDFSTQSVRIYFSTEEQRFSDVKEGEETPRYRLRDVNLIV